MFCHAASDLVTGYLREGLKTVGELSPVPQAITFFGESVQTPERYAETGGA